MDTTTRILGLLLLVSVGVGCAPSYLIPLPDRFATLREDRVGERNGYRFRATTPDGVVVAVKHLDREADGALEFWSEAVSSQLREGHGYALLGDEDIAVASGETGHLMRFGRDLEGHTYRFTVVVFVFEDHLVLVEAGGREVPYGVLESDIEASIRRMRF